MEPEIIFEDDWLAVINKPAGMVVNKAETTKEPTVQEWWMKKNDQFGSGQVQAETAEEETVNEFLDKGGVVHRLDKDTSGIMVLAKTVKAYKNLKDQFLTRQTQKTYTALIHGKLTDKHGELAIPIVRHPRSRQHFVADPQGDPARTAITEWQVTGEYQHPTHPSETLSLLTLLPHTGRTHQLRVHMQYLHHPIVADPWYGFKKSWQEDLNWCPRLFLHAANLTFTHPHTLEEKEFKIALAPDLQQVCDRLVPAQAN